MMTKIYKIYGFFGLLRLIKDKALTILFYPNARIVRFPVYIRGKKGIKGGEQLTTGINLRIDIINGKEKNPFLIIGKNVEINDYVHIGVANGVTIGDNTLIASKVFISDHNHGCYNGELQSSPDEKPISRILRSEKINIGRNVWIGEFVSILPGVTIGDGVIIGAMSVVTKDIPSNSIAVGSPARVIKVYSELTKKWEKIKN
ncbi:acetyltransferase [Flavobacterium granuli]|uniref:Lipopolysaccharide O-acetyltransferase n=1 Tax=Flavobacterium granuli TaxID=280093 RepID=A0ABU1S654_9FLAO|nr:acetyltransferase [Flavobacterium granuli]MDR6846402.1 lipopolysaccharide O-acetyltransferase [Flavobacterium granuli]